MTCLGCWIATFIITCLALPATPGVAQPGAPFQARISCGSKQDITSNNVLWQKDFGYSGGSAGSLPASNPDVVFPDLASLRYFQSTDGANNCYNITVPTGHYFFRFYFAFEVADNSDSEPEFDVSLEGTVVYQLTSNWSHSLDLRYADSLVYVGDGAATACFHRSGHGNPAVATVELLQVMDDSYSWSTDDLILKTMKRVSCGSPNLAPKFNYSADQWGGNRFWTADESIQGEASISTLITTEPILNTNLAPYFFPEGLFQSARITTVPNIPLSYTYEVAPNQNYSIWLHFAEISPDVVAEGQRVFQVLINGEFLFPEPLDILSLVDGPFNALSLNNSVLISGGTLTLTFIPINGTILVNGFEIYQVVATEYATRVEEVWALQAVKTSLKVPPIVGWNGDPCIPSEHRWEGITCDFDPAGSTWVIDAVDLHSRGLKGSIPGDVDQLTSLQSLNLSHNKLVGEIPPNLGTINALLSVDLSDNMLTGSIPATLGDLPSLQTLDLNSNQLSGKVPAAVDAGIIKGASFNLSDNPNLCGTGFSSCGTSLSTAGKVGVFVATLIAALTLAGCIFIFWKRRQNIARAQKLMLPYDAPYAKSRIANSPRPDIQLSRTSPEEFQFHSMSKESGPGHT